MRFQTTALVALVLFSASLSSPIFAQGTAFTYQGRLNSGGAVAGGIYDLRFTIYDSTNNPGVIIAGPLTNSATGVSSGLFATTLDFGAGVFTGPPRWLELAVRTNGGGAFTVLAPRQPLTPSPYAIFANTAGNLSGILPGTAISGAYSETVTFDNPANSFSGTFYGNYFGLTFIGGSFSGSFIGNGSGLGNLNGSQILSGAIPSAALGNSWRTIGNAGTSPGTHFLGTTDNQPLEFRVNNQRVFQIGTNANGSPNFLSGSPANSIGANVEGATIAGGGIGLYPNTITANYSTIGGGTFHTVSGEWATIAGGRDNVVQADHATVSGGRGNLIRPQAVYGAIGGGFGNVIDTNAIVGTIAGGSFNAIRAGSSYTTIGGGSQNSIQTNTTLVTIGGGYLNTVQSNTVYATIGGGGLNYAQSSASYSTIAGGFLNGVLANTDYGVVGGGYQNSVASSAAGIAGGFQNAIQAGSSYAAIGGGSQNQIWSGAGYATISGGSQNVVRTNAYGAVIAGGNLNIIYPNAVHSVISGGINNFVSAPVSAIGGGQNNHIDSGNDSSFIGGGYNNLVLGASSSAAAIGGGQYNSVVAAAAVIGGGYQNSVLADSTDSVIDGGLLNQIFTNATYSAIGGGYFNSIEPSLGPPSGVFAATVAGGAQNRIATNSSYATIGGGINNQVTGSGGTVPGGQANSAGSYSFAAGSFAQATNIGCFVWSDNAGPILNSTNDFSVTMRASGGYRLYSSFAAGVYLAPGSGSWTAISDRNAKENFQPLDPVDVLDRVVRLPILTWNYKSQDPSIRHVGPMAQDFNAAFRVGDSPTGITGVDADGVALAAIQGLDRKVNRLQSELDRRTAENAELKERLDALEKIIRHQP